MISGVARGPYHDMSSRTTTVNGRLALLLRNTRTVVQ